jgi:hypothetical protein
VVLPTLPELLRRLAEALSLDLIVTDEGPLVIDVNPRLVEPMNALLAGVDLVRLMLALASGAHPQAAAAGRSGVRSRQLLLTVLGVANRERAAPSSLRSRKRSAGTGVYAGAIEIFNAAQGRSARRAAGHDRDGLDPCDAVAAAAVLRLRHGFLCADAASVGGDRQGERGGVRASMTYWCGGFDVRTSIATSPPHVKSKPH